MSQNRERDHRAMKEEGQEEYKTCLSMSEIISRV